MSVKLHTENHLKFLGLKGGFTGSSESALVKMPHCWKSRVKAHIKATITGLQPLYEPLSGAIATTLGYFLKNKESFLF